MGRPAPPGEGRHQQPHRRPSCRHRSPGPPSGVVTITGGKLTTYREMAADTVDDVVEYLGALDHPVSRRSPHPQAAAAVAGQGYGRGRLGRRAGRALWRRGRSAAALVADDPPSGEPLVPGLPTCGPRPSTPPATRWPALPDDVLSWRTWPASSPGRFRRCCPDVVALLAPRARLGRRRAAAPGRRAPGVDRARAASADRPSPTREVVPGA